MKRKIMRLGIAFYCILGFSACANNVEGAGSGKALVSYESINKEFQNTVAKIKWPPGAKIPENIDEQKTDSSFQSGYGDTRASQLWECAWEREWLSVYASNKERADQALKELSKAASMRYMDAEHADDATRRFLIEAINKAKLGDASDIFQTVKVNCPE